MTDRFTDMLARKLTIDFAEKKGSLDLRNHSIGIGGAHSMPPPEKIVKGTAALKPKFIRIFLQEFFFIYPKHGVYDWTRMDAYMDAVHAMGCDIMASICIKPNALYPVVDQNIWMPNDVKEWQEVITALVLRYSKEKPYVTHWAISNETNIGEWGGCPYYIPNPDDFFEYYKFTAEPIRKALPNIKVGGPSYAALDGGKEFLGRFAELCARDNIAVDFTCYNMYSNDPYHHTNGAREIKEAICKHLPDIKLYMTEFNIGIQERFSLEEKAYDPKRAAGLAASILEMHEDGSLDGSFQYHLYDQWNDPREFASWYGITRYMAHHWNDQVHRLGLFDLNGKTRPQYFMYKLLYSLTGERVLMKGTDGVIRGISSLGDDGALSAFLVNYGEKGTPDAVVQMKFANAPEGVYNMIVTRIDKESAALMKASPVCELSPCEERIVYVHPDFGFDVFTPADTVTLVRFEPMECL